MANINFSFYLSNHSDNLTSLRDAAFLHCSLFLTKKRRHWYRFEINTFKKIPKFICWYWAKTYALEHIQSKWNMYILLLGFYLLKTWRARVHIFVWCWNITKKNSVGYKCNRLIRRHFKRILRTRIKNNSLRSKHVEKSKK